ncbi:MAG: NAD(P)H-dependent oxidoreductase [Lachnospiraceae bacterium]|nr:NAD(P)H-dependent oxidoreductase [Lachnospiraceae bacterium]
MKVLVVYCHPSKTSFTYRVYEKFLKGLQDAGHEVTISDLYEMDFKTDLSEEEYLRETYYRAELPVAEDVKAEQEKIQTSDAIAFIYPIFWTEAPAKLVGWFDRVWSTGFAYAPNPEMKVLDKALFIACAGKSLESLEETGEKSAMETVMLGDRIRTRAIEKQMVIFDNITHWNEELGEATEPVHLQKAYELGKSFCGDKSKGESIIIER